jgi:hypothetical protein
VVEITLGQVQGHFGALGENLLAHVRLNDRLGPNGEKILFIEEIQSDWAQAGREKGFGPRAAGSLEEEQGLKAKAAELRRQMDELDNSFPETEEQARLETQRYNELAYEASQLERQAGEEVTHGF